MAANLDSTTDPLAAWCSDKPNWLRMIVLGAAECEQPLSEDQLDRAFSAFLIENQLAEGHVEGVDLPSQLTKKAKDRAVLRLSNLHHVSGVNALRPSTRVDFNTKLTLIFGENAAGKSGYVRILKALSAARCREDILPPTDVDAPPPRQVSVAFTLDGSPASIDWDFENSVGQLSEVDVFDSRFAQIHVDHRLEYSYTPKEVAVFANISSAIQRVREKLVAMIDAAAVYRTDFQAGIPEGASFRAAVSCVDASTDIDWLRSLAVLSNDETIEYERVKERIGLLVSKDKTAALKQLALDTSLLSEAETAYALIRDYNWSHLNAATASLRRALNAYSESGLQDIKAPSPAIESREWRDFIEAGDKLIQAHLGSEYPRDGSACIYCGQQLDGDAIALLQRYHVYCTGELKRLVDQAAADVASCGAELRLKNFSAISDRLKVRGEVEVGAAKAIWQEVGEMIDRAEEARSQISAGFNLSPQQQSAFTSEDSDKIGRLRDEHSELRSVLSGEDTQRSEELLKAMASAAEYEARQTLSLAMDEIERSVRAAVWVKAAQSAATKFKKILRSLTDAAKAASRLLLDEGFEAHFLEECERLHAPLVKLAFPGGEARVERVKFISDRYTISQVFSEGEQKAVALADFLAESRLRSLSSPIVFDDPVNSLDYKRIRYVAERLSELANDRQVIIFTHNIWFATEVLSRFETCPSDCTYYDIEAAGREKGVLTQGNSPRTDTFKRNKAVINELIQGATSLSGEARQALVERAYEYLRNTCEIIVEHDLFRGVSRRYEPNIRMTTLDKINYDRLQEACTKTFSIFEDCCRKIASHSQPIETLNVRPDLNELKRDWHALQQVRGEYIA